MPSADIQAKIALDATSLKFGLKEAQSSVSGFTQSANALKGQLAGVFTIGAISAFVNEMGDYSEKMLNMSANTGISTDSLQALEFSLKQNGGNVEGLASSLNKLKTAQTQAVAGSKEQVETFAALGISQQELINLSPEQMLERVAKGYVASGQSGEAFISTTKLLGKDLSELNGTLNEVASVGMAEFTKAAKEAGHVIDENSLAQWDMLTDRIAGATDWVKKLAGSLAGKVADIGAFWGAIAGGASMSEASQIVEDIKADDLKAKKTEANDKAALQRQAEIKKAKEAESKEFDELLKKSAELGEANRKARLTDLQKAKELEKEIADLQAKERGQWDKGDRVGAMNTQIEAVKKQGELAKIKEKQKEADDKERADKAKQVEQLQADLLKIRKEEADKIKGVFGKQESNPAGEWQRVGRFVGYTADRNMEDRIKTAALMAEANRIHKESLTRQTEIRDKMQALLAKGNGGTFS